MKFKVGYDKISFMTNVLLDALLDAAKILPFLILAYVLIEVIEHTASSKISTKLLKGKLSPLIGAGVGIIPQCGFSVVATKLYTSRAIAMGTLLAVYISTSDEAVAVLISDFSALNKLWPLLLIKAVYAVIVGYVFNFLMRKRELKEVGEHVSTLGCHDHVVGVDEHCGHCHEHEHESKEEKDMYRKNAIKRFVLHPLMHAFTTFIYVFVVDLVIGTMIFFIGEQALSDFMGRISYLQPLLSALVGLIPNCAASVVIARMYALGTLSLGGALSGLCVSAGIGVAVLIKENKPVKDTAVVIGSLFALSVALGIIVTAVCAFIG